jgi:hypothetical protein
LRVLVSDEFWRTELSTLKLIITLLLNLSELYRLVENRWVCFGLSYCWTPNESTTISTTHTMTTATSTDQTVIYNPYMGAIQPIREVCVCVCLVSIFWPHWQVLLTRYNGPVCVCVWQPNFHYISIKLEIKWTIKTYFLITPVNYE